MNENHCVSLELSKKLKEAGYPQEGEYWFGKIKTKKRKSAPEGYFWYLISPGEDEQRPMTMEEIVAPLASELMERLPAHINQGWKFSEPILYIKKWDDEWQVKYEGEDGHCSSCCEIEILCQNSDTNICNALAKMYLYLSDHNLLPKESK